jgi:hypothetical protein
MINDLVQWVANRIGDQRSYPRKNERFAVTWLSDAQTEKPATGVEISPNGLVFQMREKPSLKELNLRFTFRNRVIPVRVSVKRADPIVDNGHLMNRFACRFLGISADDWDLIVRHVHDLDEPENKAAGELEDILKKEDDAYRLLPLRVQDKVVNMLVRAHRLEPPSEGALPHLRLHYIGSAQTEKGSKVLKINIHSRKRVDDAWYAFDTQFAIDESSGDVQPLETAKHKD